MLILVYYTTGLQPQPGSPSNLVSSLTVEGDLPEVKRDELNILAASEELAVRSLSEMKKGLHTLY